MTEAPEQRTSLRSLTDLVEVVPTLLGFHPTDSLVLVALDNGRVELAARVDLDVTGGHRTATALRPVWQRLPHASHVLIAYSDDAERSWWALDDVAATIPQGCPRTVLHADGGRWYSDPDDAGTPYDRLGSVHLARAAWDGRPVRRSRAELVELTRPGRTPAEVTASLERVAAREATLRDVVSEAMALVVGHDEAPGDLEIDEATILCLASHDPVFLEEVLLGTTRANAAVRVALWAQVVRASVPNCAGAALVALGLAGWVDGEGAIQSVCLEALAERPGPAEWVGLLDAINADAVHPDEWEGIRARLRDEGVATAS